MGDMVRQVERSECVCINNIFDGEKGERNCAKMGHYIVH